MCTNYLVQTAETDVSKQNIKMDNMQDARGEAQVF